GLFFGVEVLKVQEVLRHREMTRVPLGPPPAVRGLINLRGQIVPAIDLRSSLQLRGWGNHPSPTPPRGGEGPKCSLGLPSPLRGGAGGGVLSHGLSERPSDHLPMNVVVRTDEGPMSLLVDEIGDVLELGEETFERSPETLTGVARELIRG